MKSPKRSWKGFKLSKNFLSAVKKALYVMVPAVVAELVAHNLITTGIAGVVGPMVLNAVEYWLKQY